MRPARISGVHSRSFARNLTSINPPYPYLFYLTERSAVLPFFGPVGLGEPAVSAAPGVLVSYDGSNYHSSEYHRLGAEHCPRSLHGCLTGMTSGASLPSSPRPRGPARPWGWSTAAAA